MPFSKSQDLIRLAQMANARRAGVSLNDILKRLARNLSMH